MSPEHHDGGVCYSLNSFSLAGHSHGGSVALKYALAYPDRLDRLLVFDSGPFVRDPDPAWLETRSGYEAARVRWAARDTTLTPDELHSEFIHTFVPALHFYDYEPVRQTIEDLLARTTFSAEPRSCSSCPGAGTGRRSSDPTCSSQPSCAFWQALASRDTALRFHRTLATRRAPHDKPLQLTVAFGARS